MSVGQDKRAISYDSMVVNRCKAISDFLSDEKFGKINKSPLKRPAARVHTLVHGATVKRRRWLIPNSCRHEAIMFMRVYHVNIYIYIAIYILYLYVYIYMYILRTETRNRGRARGVEIAAQDEDTDARRDRGPGAGRLYGM